MSESLGYKFVGDLWATPMAFLMRNFKKSIFNSAPRNKGFLGEQNPRGQEKGAGLFFGYAARLLIDLIEKSIFHFLRIITSFRPNGMV